MEMEMEVKIKLGSCSFLCNMKTLGKSALTISDIFSLPLLGLHSAHAAGDEAKGI
jgi:hypothetical protein